MFSPPNTAASDETLEAVDPRVPMSLILGPDGVGKNALIEKMAQDAQADGENCAMIFTAKADWQRAWRGGALISNNIAQSTSGTICCFADADIVDAFYRLHLLKLGLLTPKIDYNCVLVALGEGLDTATFVATVQNNDRIDLTYRIAGIVCAMEPHDCSQSMAEKNQQMIAQADTLVLTGTDNCSSEDIAAARRTLTSINPLAAIYVTGTLCLPRTPAWRIPLGSFKQADYPQLTQKAGMVQISTPGEAAVCFAGNLYNVAGWNSPTGMPPVRAMRICIPGELDIAKYMQVVDEMVRTIGKGLFRLSAILDIRHADYPILFEMISGNVIHPAYGLNRHTGSSDICIIGRGLNVQNTFRAFRECAWETAATKTRFEAAI